MPKGKLLTLPQAREHFVRSRLVRFAYGPNFDSTDEAVYFVSGSKRNQEASSAHAKLADALAKASEFMSAGMLHVKIDDLERSDYTDVEIKLLLGLAEAEHFKPGQAPSLAPHVAEKPKWSLFKRIR